MKRFQKVYLEISNLCNLRCGFCPGTRRPPKRLSEEEFSHLMSCLRPYTDYLYFHLMGEPLCHPEIGRFLALAQEYGFRVILTTNGTLLTRQRDTLLNAPALHKINISLHAFEANELDIPFSEYLNGCFSFGRAAKGGPLLVYRLWNRGGADEKNDEILTAMEHSFPKPWTVERRGTRIAHRVYLEYGEKFDWPDLNAEDGGRGLFCYGLRDQIGVLCDGTVVPCCLDHEGDIALGNLFQQSMEEILSSQRARALYEGFSRREAVEPLCRRCGYARRFE
ncbi:MAG: radical SAM/SPASM domain-containing protein [Eubacteriales bacterium]|nr:radical SAM/SPASM domain-containing protein [Eubacteriales bacterium]